MEFQDILSQILPMEKSGKTLNNLYRLFLERGSKATIGTWLETASYKFYIYNKR